MHFIAILFFHLVFGKKRGKNFSFFPLFFTIYFSYFLKISYCLTNGIRFEFLICQKHLNSKILKLLLLKSKTKFFFVMSQKRCRSLGFDKQLLRIYVMISQNCRGTQHFIMILLSYQPVVKVFGAYQTRMNKSSWIKKRKSKMQNLFKKNCLLNFIFSATRFFKKCV